MAQPIQENKGQGPKRGRGRPRKFFTPLEEWIRENRGGDREKFADEIGVSLASLERVLRRRGYFHAEKYLKIKEITGLGVDEILVPVLP